ncbi:hypothetical protein [Kitasatospora phosalacinea]|uniref:hypothetical protein n=1 Tax=Kitasatospora phosalacinea TaxID=2065 RepID=UPI000524AD26|nr:hypothetical protein [Kitasatospora phosalacinea]
MSDDTADRSWAGANRLAELIGTEVRVTVSGDSVHVMLELPSGAGDSHHLEVLTVLRAADRFGHRRTADGVEQLWATYFRPEGGGG